MRPNWSKGVNIGLNRFKLIQIGLKWSKKTNIICYGLIWSKIVQILTKKSSKWVWHNLVSYFSFSLFFTEYAPILIQLVTLDVRLSVVLCLPHGLKTSETVIVG